MCHVCATSCCDLSPAVHTDRYKLCCSNACINHVVASWCRYRPQIRLHDPIEHLTRAQSKIVGSHPGPGYRDVYSVTFHMYDRDSDRDDCDGEITWASFSGYCSPDRFKALRALTDCDYDDEDTLCQIPGGLDHLR